ncbi:hypothetical protein Tco_1301869 [Tanacetum coccineum]
MSFSLKNVDSACQSHVGINLEAYVDGMVIKINDEGKMLVNIAKMFGNLQKINMKLNPKKCSFDIEDGKFLCASSPGRPKGRYQFFKMLKNITKENNDEYRWTKEAEKAFQEMKKLIMDLLSLTTPSAKETLHSYLAAFPEAMSDVLLT